LSSLRSRIYADGWKRIIALPVYGLLWSRDLRRYAREAIFQETELNRLLTDSAKASTSGWNPRQELDRVLGRAAGASALDQALYLDIKTYLPSLLIVEDRVSMAHSLEDRVPILDHRIAELSARIPGRLKIKGLALKQIPRRNAEGLLPRSVVGKKKIGFLVPLATWLRGPLKQFVEDLLLTERALSRGIFKRGVVERLVREHLAGSRDHSAKLWCLLNVELWHRIWIDGEIPEMPHVARYLTQSPT